MARLPLHIMLRKMLSALDFAEQKTEGECVNSRSNQKFKLTQAPSVTLERATFLSEEGLLKFAFVQNTEVQCSNRLYRQTAYCFVIHRG